MGYERMPLEAGREQSDGAIPIDPIGDDVRQRVHAALIAGGLVTGTSAAETFVAVPPFDPPIASPAALPGLGLGIDDAE